MTRSSFIASVTVVFFIVLLGNAQKVEAGWVDFYYNPHWGACSVTPPFTPTPAQEAAGWYRAQSCVFYSGGESVNDTTICDNVWCAPGFNDYENPTGASATYGAGTDKNTYSPGATVQLKLVAATGDRGDDLPGYLSTGLLNPFNLFHGLFSDALDCQ